MEAIDASKRPTHRRIVDILCPLLNYVKMYPFEMDGPGIIRLMNVVYGFLSRSSQICIHSFSSISANNDSLMYLKKNLLDMETRLVLSKIFSLLDSSPDLPQKIMTTTSAPGLGKTFRARMEDEDDDQRTPLLKGCVPILNTKTHSHSNSIFEPLVDGKTGAVGDIRRSADHVEDSAVKNAKETYNEVDKFSSVSTQSLCSLKIVKYDTCSIEAENNNDKKPKKEEDLNLDWIKPADQSRNTYEVQLSHETEVNKLQLPSWMNVEDDSDDNSDSDVVETERKIHVEEEPAEATKIDRTSNHLHEDTEGKCIAVDQEKSFSTIGGQKEASCSNRTSDPTNLVLDGESNKVTDHSKHAEPEPEQPPLTRNYLLSARHGLRTELCDVDRFHNIDLGQLATLVCGLLNTHTGGAIYLGVKQNGLIKGVKLDRKQRDKVSSLDFLLTFIRRAGSIYCRRDSCWTG